MIEHGRYQIDHLPRENRLCPLCNSNQVEDEIHFLFHCNKYSVQRQAFINQINRIIPDFDKKSSPESIKLIMNSKEHHFKIHMFFFVVVVCFYYILQIIFKQVLWSGFSTQVRYYFIHIVLSFISVIRLDFV